MKFKIFFDEAGRWPLAWPVVVWGVVKLEEFDDSIFKDSKKLSEKKREQIFQQIQQLEKQNKLIFGFGYGTNEEIDKLWIVPAINLATKRTILAIFAKYIKFFENQILPQKNFFDWNKFLAIQQLKQQIQSPHYPELIQTFNKIEKLHWLIFDGNTDFWLSKDLNFKVITVIKWDDKVPLIWAASIVAKVTRDQRMKQISDKYPQYNFAKHKGYGTKAHRQAIQQSWPCKLHRKTFLKNIPLNNQ